MLVYINLLKDLLSQLTILLQDSIHGFRINIRTEKKIDFDKLESSIDASNLRSFVNSLTAGYDTILGDKGSRISGGQKQRIVIERAIYKGAKVLIIEDVITTGKSSIECVKLIKKANAKLLGFASIIDRSTKQSIKIKTGIISHLKINVPTFSEKQLPQSLKSIPITIPGSRFIK